MPGKAVKKVELVTIPPINLSTVMVTIVGDSPFVSHRFSDAAKEAIEGKQTQKAKGARKARDPEAEYHDSMYTIPGKTGCFIPTKAFKCAIIDAGSFVVDITKVKIRGLVYVFGPKAHPGYAKIEGDEPHMEMDVVRLPNGSADLRYRAYFTDWRVVLRVLYDRDLISAEQVVNLFNRGGFSIGVGDRRPQQSGDVFGMFHAELKKK